MAKHKSLLLHCAWGWKKQMWNTHNAPAMQNENICALPPPYTEIWGQSVLMKTS